MDRDDFLNIATEACKSLHSKLELSGEKAQYIAFIKVGKHAMCDMDGDPEDISTMITNGMVNGIIRDIMYDAVATFTANHIDRVIKEQKIEFDEGLTS